MSDLIGTIMGWDGKPCDAKTPSVMFTDGKMVCRCLVCARCSEHASGTYGHYTGGIFCKNTGGEVKHHFCCPDDCELADA